MITQDSHEQHLKEKVKEAFGLTEEELCIDWARQMFIVKSGKMSGWLTFKVVEDSSVEVLRDKVGWE